MSSENDGDALIGTVLGDASEIHEADKRSPGSVSPSLTEQYSIASCSYPPLSWTDLTQLSDGLPLSTYTSGHDLLPDLNDLEAGLSQTEDAARSR